MLTVRSCIQKSNKRKIKARVNYSKKNIQVRNILQISIDKSGNIIYFNTKQQYIADLNNNNRRFLLGLQYGKSRKANLGTEKKAGPVPRGLGRDFRRFAQNNQLRRTRESEPVHQRFEQDGKTTRFRGYLKREGIS